MAALIYDNPPDVVGEFLHIVGNLFPAAASPADRKDGHRQAYLHVFVEILNILMRGPVVFKPGAQHSGLGIGPDIFLQVLLGDGGSIESQVLVKQREIGAPPTSYERLR